MNEETEVSEPNPQPVALRGNKRKAARDHFVEELAKINLHGAPRFDLALLPRTDLPDAEWNAMMQRVLLAVAAALKGAFIESAPEVSKAFAEVEQPEIQIKNHRAWQRQRSGYFQWNEYEHRQLLEHLQKHPGSVLIPNFAHSCDIRESSGRVYTWRREGKAT